MIMIKALKILFFAVFIMVSRNNIGYACSCISPESPGVEFSNAAVVFTGKVIDINQVDEQRADFKFKILRNFRGPANEFIVVGAGTEGPMCGYNFQKGEEYLV